MQLKPFLMRIWGQQNAGGGPAASGGEADLSAGDSGGADGATAAAAAEPEEAQAAEGRSMDR